MAIAGKTTDPTVRAPVSVTSDADVVEALRPIYLEGRQRDLDLLRSCLADGKYAEIGRIGHNLKGSGRSYGLPEFASFGEELERAAGSRDAEGVRTLLDHLAATLAQRTPDRL